MVAVFFCSGQLAPKFAKQVVRATARFSLKFAYAPPCHKRRRGPDSCRLLLGCLPSASRFLHRDRACFCLHCTIRVMAKLPEVTRYLNEHHPARPPANILLPWVTDPPNVIYISQEDLRDGRPLWGHVQTYVFFERLKWPRVQRQNAVNGSGRYKLPQTS